MKLLHLHLSLILALHLTCLFANSRLNTNYKTALPGSEVVLTGVAKPFSTNLFWLNTTARDGVFIGNSFGYLNPAVSGVKSVVRAFTNAGTDGFLGVGVANSAGVISYTVPGSYLSPGNHLATVSEAALFFDFKNVTDTNKIVFSQCSATVNTGGDGTLTLNNTGNNMKLTIRQLNINALSNTVIEMRFLNKARDSHFKIEWLDTDMSKGTSTNGLWMSGSATTGSIKKSGNYWVVRAYLGCHSTWGADYPANNSGTERITNLVISGNFSNNAISDDLIFDYIAVYQPTVYYHGEFNTGTDKMIPVNSSASITNSLGVLKATLSGSGSTLNHGFYLPIDRTNDGGLDHKSFNEILLNSRTLTPGATDFSLIARPVSAGWGTSFNVTGHTSDFKELIFNYSADSKWGASPRTNGPFDLMFRWDRRNSTGTTVYEFDYITIRAGGYQGMQRLFVFDPRFSAFDARPASGPTVVLRWSDPNRASGDITYIYRKKSPFLSKINETGAELIGTKSEDNDLFYFYDRTVELNTVYYYALVRPSGTAFPNDLRNDNVSQPVYTGALTVNNRVVELSDATFSESMQAVAASHELLLSAVPVRVVNAMVKTYASLDPPLPANSSLRDLHLIDSVFSVNGNSAPYLTSTYVALNVIDNNTETAWALNQLNNELIFSLKQEVFIDQMKFKGSGNITRIPTTMDLHGSVKGDRYTLIINNITPNRNGNWQTREIGASEAYRFLKLVLKGAETGETIQSLAEIDFIGHLTEEIIEEKSDFHFTVPYNLTLSYDTNRNGVIDSTTFSTEPEVVSKLRLFHWQHGSWVFAGGTPLASGDMISSPISYAGTYALFLSKTPDPDKLVSSRLLRTGRGEKIWFYVTATGNDISLKVYDIKGKLVKIVMFSEKASGELAVAWDGTDEQNYPVSGGVYFYTVADNYRIVLSSTIVVVR